MKKITFLFLFISVLFSLYSCKTEEPWQPLFNGRDLTGWDTWIGPTEEGGDPIGLNNDPLNLFSVVDLDGDKVIRISGEVNASMATKQEFENYHISWNLNGAKKCIPNGIQDCFTIVMAILVKVWECG